MLICFQLGGGSYEPLKSLWLRVWDCRRSYTHTRNLFISLFLSLSHWNSLNLIVYFIQRALKNIRDICISVLTVNNPLINVRLDCHFIDSLWMLEHFSFQCTATTPGCIKDLFSLGWLRLNQSYMYSTLTPDFIERLLSLYGQIVSIHSSFTLNKQQLFSLGEINTQMIYK